MPAAREYYPNLDSAEAKAVEQAFEDEQRKRANLFEKNWKYYYGNHKPPLKLDKSGTDDNLIINHIELVIDKGISGLLGVDDHGLVKGIDFEVVDKEPEQPNVVQRAVSRVREMVGAQKKDKPEEQYIEAVMKANASSILFLDALLNGGVCGHIFLKLLPDGEETDDGLEVPRIVVLDPANVTVFWDEDDKSRVLWFRIQYGSNYDANGVVATSRQDIVRDEDSAVWWIYKFRRTGTWQQDGVEEMWPYSWPPIIDWKNLPNPQSYYGRDDIGGKIKLNDGLNLTASNMQRIIKHHASPKTIGTGFTNQEVLETSVDGLWTIANQDAKVYNLEMQSDLGSTRSMIDLERNSIYDTARELNPGTVADKLGAITNFGLRVLHADSLAKGGIKRLLASEGLKRLCRHILELGGFNPRVTINVIWPEPLPSDPLQTAQALQIMSALGLSNETALIKAGYDPEEEARNREMERQESMRNTPPQLRDTNTDESPDMGMDGSTMPSNGQMMNNRGMNA